MSSIANNSCLFIIDDKSMFMYVWVCSVYEPKYMSMHKNIFLYVKNIYTSLGYNVKNKVPKLKHA